MTSEVIPWRDFPQWLCPPRYMPATSDVNKANSVKAKQYKAKARGAQGQGLIEQGQGLAFQGHGQGLTLQG